MSIIDELEEFLARAEDAKGDDIRLMDIHYDMEMRYNIPKFAADIERWEENTPDGDRILRIYRLIFSLRKA